MSVHYSYKKCEIWFFKEIIMKKSLTSIWFISLIEMFKLLQSSVQSCHPIMHKMVAQNVGEFLEQSNDLLRYLERLMTAKKNMFLVTNSPFDFVWVINMEFKYQCIASVCGKTSLKK